MSRGRRGSGTQALATACIASTALVVSACAGGPGPGAVSASASSAATAGSCGGTIAILAPMTGAAARPGTEQVQFAQLAVDDFNAVHGSSYRISEHDTQLDPGQASTQAQAVVDDASVIAMLGPSSSQEAAAVGPLMTSAGLAYVSASATNPGLTDGRNPTFFRVVPNDDVQAPTIAAFMAGELGSRKVAIIEERTDFGTGLSRRLERLLADAGIETVTLPVSKDKRNYEDVVSRIPRDADTVFLPFQVASKAQQFGLTLEKNKRDVRLVASEGSYTPEFSIPGAHVLSIAPDIRAMGGEGAQVAARFEERHGEFTGLSAPMYVATQAVLAASQASCEAKGGPPDRSDVLAQLRGTRVPDSILGSDIAFDARGDVQGAGYRIFRVEPDGSFALVR